MGSLATVVANDPEVLSWSSPTGQWRVGAFEVVDLADRALLFSKLDGGEHLVDSAERLAAFVAKLGVQE